MNTNIIETHIVENYICVLDDDTPIQLIDSEAETSMATNEEISQDHKQIEQKWGQA